MIVKNVLSIFFWAIITNICKFKENYKIIILNISQLIDGNHELLLFVWLLPKNVKRPYFI
jgi:hypothetical protein